MTGRRPRTIREQTVDRSLAVLSLYASLSMRPLAHPQAAANRTLGIHVFGPRASALIVERPAAIALSLSSEDIAPHLSCSPGPDRHLSDGTLTVASGTVAPGRSPQRSGPSLQV
jgi:hypothetical protein